jgi:hypothetical protein
MEQNAVHYVFGNIQLELFVLQRGRMFFAS